jgi:tetratricopeptide (TPR) repeat protein/TolB-like protein
MPALERVSVPPRPTPVKTQTNVDLARRLAPGTLVAARYRIFGQLGVGGMGVVYKARDEELGTDIAIKVLRPDLGTNPEWISRFRRELVLAREVTHKNVVRIHDIGESEGLRFLTMSLVDGRSLLDVLGESGPLPVDRALNIFRQVAEALQQAHDAGIVHRDIKPGNILLGPHDVAYITDFGVARSLEHSALTRSGSIVGTLDYLSPEQVAGDPLDARSDIYALGIVLFEMVTNQLPFNAGSQAEALAQRLTGRPRDIDETGVHVPGYVRNIIRRCLERNRGRRYASVRELIADLDAKRAPSRIRFPRAAVPLGLVLLAGAATAVYHPWTAGRRPGSPTSAGAPLPEAAPVSVAVLPLADETGDPALAWAATGMAEMLAGHLAETPQLRVLDSGRVVRTLHDLALARATRDEASLKRLAELLEVNRLVTGTVRRAGTTLRVDLSLVSPSGAGSVASRTMSAETTDAAGLFRLVGELGERLRGELGAPRPSSRPLPEPQTASLEAAKAYREGRERLAVGDSVGAAPSFERALRADPAFAAALLGLSEAYQALGYHDKALAASEKAAETVGSAQTRLAWRVRARLALLRGDLAEAEKAYAELVTRYPNDTEALLDLAAAQASEGAIAKAVLTLKRVTELDRSDPRAWFLLGKNMILAGDARKAVTDPLVRALALMTQLENGQGQGDVLNAMGVAHERLGEYPQALARYAEAAAVRKKVGDKRGAAVSLKNRASVHLAMGRFAEAEPDLLSAREVYLKIGDRKGLADVWNDFGSLHEGRGEYREAQKAYQEALRLRRELGDDQKLAQSYDNVGYIFFLEGERDNAFVYWQQALDLRRKVGDKAGIVVSTQNMGFLQIAQGRWPEAMKSFLEALDRAREIDFTKALAVSHGNIGLLQQYEGRYAAASSAYAETLKILKQLDDKRGLAEFTIKEAMALIELGRLGEAQAKLDAASAWVQETGNREQAADLQAAVGELQLAKGEVAAAGKAFAQAVELATASGSRVAILRARIAQGGALLALGDAAGAASTLTSSVREAETVGDVILCIRGLESLARAELARGRLPQAEDAGRRALRAAERSGWGAGLYRLHALLGRVQEKKGNAAGAMAAYRESARSLSVLTEGLAPELRSSLASVPAAREVGAWLADHPQSAGR